jgi:hypothetical protein
VAELPRSESFSEVGTLMFKNPGLNFAQLNRFRHGSIIGRSAKPPSQEIKKKTGDCAVARFQVCLIVVRVIAPAVAQTPLPLPSQAFD